MLEQINTISIRFKREFDWIYKQIETLVSQVQCKSKNISTLVYMTNIYVCYNQSDLHRLNYKHIIILKILVTITTCILLTAIIIDELEVFLYTATVLNIKTCK